MRGLGVAGMIFAGILALVFWRYAPPPARGAEEPVGRFSAERALAVGRAISGDGTPRTMGTEANARARAFLQGELTRIGWKTEIEEAMACTRHGACGNVVNIIASRSGREPGATTVLLMAHHDSAPCSPGAGDDGFGIAAVVEAARAIAASPQLRRTVVIVLTDGEEAGLLGAAAFVRDHPLARTMRGAVNIDARGSSGPSAMFETNTGNAWIVGLYAQSVDRPVTSSLFYELYRRMPNDTDFTLVKDLVHGVNFANAGRVEHYHTPLDSLAHADPGTLQHHGDQALAMVRALADAGPELDAPRAAKNDAVWFDVLAFFVVRWPARATLGLAIAALALVGAWTLRMRAFGRGLAASASAVLGAVLASLAAGGALRAIGALPVPWLAHPLPALIALHGICVVAGLASARLVGGKSSGPHALWAGTWLMWGVVGVVTAAVAPGASYLFIVPSLAAGLAGWLTRLTRRTGLEIASVLPSAVAAVLWLPLVPLVYDGLGVRLPAVACISSIVLVSTLPALFRESSSGPAATSLVWRTIAGLTGGSLAIAVLVAMLVPSYSTEVPQRVNVVFRQDEADDERVALPARVYVESAWGPMPWGRAPDGMRRALGDPARVRSESPTPWSSPVLMTEVPRIALPAPQALVTSTSSAASGGRTVRVRIRSARAAGAIALVLPATPPLRVLVQGHAAVPRYGAIRLRAIPAEGIDVEIHAEGSEPLEFLLLDMTPGLPPADVAPVARAVLDARPAEATQTQDGDITIASRRLRL